MELIRADVVFAEGAEADACYIVTDGRVAISNKSIDGRESMVAIMERGDLFGEMGLFDGLGRSAEARSLEPSSVHQHPLRRAARRSGRTSPSCCGRWCGC